MQVDDAVRRARGDQPPEVKIITVEDPVEYRLVGINQIQINIKAGLTFANALRTILRSDPDVIMVGEIRDPETAKISIESASPATSSSPRCTRTTRPARSPASTRWASSRS